MKSSIIFVLFLLIFSVSCKNKNTEIENSNELVLNEIKLPEKFKNTELSGLAWYKDSLLFVLPENFSNSNETPKIFTVEKEEVIKCLSTKEINKFSEINIYFDKDVDLSKAQGLEAVCFNNEIVYFSLERDNYTAFLLKGTFLPNENKIQVEKTALIEHPLNEIIENSTIEAICFYDDFVYCFHECNGKTQNNNKSVVSKYTSDLDFVDYVPIENLEYRITDVTSVENNTFFALNFYFYKAEFERYKPVNDEFISNISDNDSHFENIEKNYLKKVERIIEFKIENDSVTIINAPQYFKLGKNERNIEGVEYLNFENSKYFFISTDRFPEDNIYFTKIL